MSGDLPPEPLGEVLERNCGDWSPHECADFAREHAARCVERERERLRGMLPPEVFDCGAYYNALDALIADLRVLCPDCFDATGGSDAG